MSSFNYNKINGNKEQFRTILSLIQGDAIRHGVEVDVLTLSEYQSIPGNAGLIPNPLIAPIRPAANAHATVWRIYDSDDKKFTTRNDASKGIRAGVINILREQDIEAIQDHLTGMRDVTLLDILQKLKETLLQVTVADITIEETKLREGIAFDVDKGVHAFLGKYKSTFQILATNDCPVPNLKKIQYIQEELKKLRCTEINGFITDWNRQHGTIAAKVFNIFEQDLINAFQAISKDTLKSAGYSAKISDSKDATIAAMQEQIQKTQDQIQTLTNLVANSAKVTSAQMWCSTHMWGNHVSKDCRFPKKDHKMDEMRPPNKKKRKA